MYSPEAWSVLAFPGSFYRQDGEKAAVILHKSSDFWCRGKRWEDVESRGDESGRVMVGHGARRGACETCQNTYWLVHSTRSWVKAALVSGDSASNKVRLHLGGFRRRAEQWQSRDDIFFAEIRADRFVRTVGASRARGDLPISEGRSCDRDDITLRPVCRGVLCSSVSGTLGTTRSSRKRGYD